ncbi:MAG: DUF615 domain-containing protein [Desulfovibrionales bacterium]|nr:DUF615 domain-containing protein [Desulfovibrionales bacterium]
MTIFEHGYSEEREDQPSKSQRKRDMLALQEIGKRLTALTPEHLERMELPEPLLDAIALYHRLKDKEARRRHMQFIGALMRKTEVEPIQQALADLDQLHVQRTEDFHQLEVWRDALVAGDEQVLAEVVQDLGLEKQKLMLLARGAAQEKAAGKPSKNGRALFRLLRQALEQREE